MLAAAISDVECWTGVVGGISGSSLSVNSSRSRSIESFRLIGEFCRESDIYVSC